MIPKETLIATITSFDKLRSEKNAHLETLSKSKDTWSLEEFLKWQKMEDAWRELELVIEHKLLPFVENTPDISPFISSLEIESLQIATLQVTDAKIVNSDKRNRITGGTYITFLSKDTIAKDTYVDVIIDNHTHHFQVKDIVIQGELLQIDAVETGYWARKIDRKDGFDLRTILGLPVTVVTDEDKKKQIYTESCWC